MIEDVQCIDPCTCFEPCVDSYKGMNTLAIPNCVGCPFAQKCDSHDTSVAMSRCGNRWAILVNTTKRSVDLGLPYANEESTMHVAAAI